jgi:4a-hydroxytetrahydrobiopterin dehydratase
MPPIGTSKSSPVKLSDQELALELTKLRAWKVEGDKLRREYVFADFVSAFGFMASAALVAQALDHHPEWTNIWNKVRIDLTTHDAAGITGLDVKLAHAMEELAQRQPPK